MSLSIQEFGWMCVEAVAAVLLAAWLGWAALFGAIVGGLLIAAHEAIAADAEVRAEAKYIEVDPAQWKLVAPHGFEADPIWLEPMSDDELYERAELNGDDDPSVFKFRRGVPGGNPTRR
jgi:hypothetical protein